MKIIDLSWKNIFSYGDDVTTLTLGDEGKLWQLSGKSGAGKSSLLSVPKLLLFGKTEGGDGKPVNVADISNWINKKGWIRGTVQNGDAVYVIERTFNPSTLNIWKNGESLDKAGMRNMQGIIDVEILDNMPYNIFSNVMSLSLNNFKSFISMTPADKRQIIDKIFSMEIINKVYELVKKDMKDLGNSINVSNSQVYSLEQTLKTSRAELESLSSGSIDSGTQQILDSIKAKLEKVDFLYKQQYDLYTSLYGQYNDVYQTYSKVRMAIQGKNSELGTVQQKINLFNQDKCPTCGTLFNSEEFVELRELLLAQKSEIEDTLETYRKNESELNASLQTLQINMTEVQTNMGKITAKKNELNTEFARVEASAQNMKGADAIRNIISSTEQTKSEIEAGIIKANENMKMLEVMEEMYSADGIKQTMMSNYIPSLNEEIAETLNSLGFPYTLTFDGNFDPHLQYIGKDIKPQNLSVGEHKKVDLTVLCSLLKMIKRKYPQINLVCLDETVSSLDYDSSTEIIKYLRQISRDMNLNIFIVSHTMLDENLFDEHILIEKPAEYSVLRKI